MGTNWIKVKFTMIELLAVISIIMILFSLLLPALDKSKRLARSIQCLNNEKQGYVAMANYAGDYDSMLPPINNRFPTMDPFTSSIFTGSLERWYYGDCYSGMGLLVQCGYLRGGKNQQCAPIFYCPNTSISAGNAIISITYYYIGGLKNTPPYTSPLGSRIRLTDNPRCLIMWCGYHGTGVWTPRDRKNVLFLDGHAKSQRPLLPQYSAGYISQSLEY